MKVNLLKSLCLLSALVVVGCSTEGRATLTVVNQSGKTVALLHVKVHENIQTVKDLEHGEEVEMQFPVKFDAHYHIYVEFTSGRTMRKDVGYLASMASISDKVIINQTDIEFERVSVGATK